MYVLTLTGISIITVKRVCKKLVASHIPMNMKRLYIYLLVSVEPSGIVKAHLNAKSVGVNSTNAVT